jgi:hypothetical protein
MAREGTFPPLISPRSPSYARARRELANPSPAGDAQVVAVLARLAELEENAARATRKGAEVAKDPTLAAQLREAALLHDARRQDMAELIATLGGSAPRTDESRDLLTHDAASVGRAVEDDQVREELHAMRDELVAAYGEAVASPELDDKQRSALAQLAPH